MTMEQIIHHALPPEGLDPDGRRVSRTLTEIRTVASRARTALGTVTTPIYYTDEPLPGENERRTVHTFGGEPNGRGLTRTDVYLWRDPATDEIVQILTDLIAACEKFERTGRPSPHRKEQ